jgi:type II secretory pathway component PulC
MKILVAILALGFSADAFAEAEKPGDVVAKQAGCVPSFEDGKPAGYKCVDTKSSGIYDNLGMKNGDVIQDVNGEHPSDPKRALELMGKTKVSAQFETARHGTDPSIDQEPVEGPYLYDETLSRPSDQDQSNE